LKAAIVSLVVVVVMVFWAVEVVFLSIDDRTAWGLHEDGAYCRDATFELAILGKVTGLYGTCEENSDFISRFQA
jgi:hypothetical protein